MSATEERVVRMRFDNAQFKKAAGDTQTQLANIDKAVSSAGKGKGLLDMAGHMDTVRVKASAMQVAAVTAIANIANRAVNAGIQMAKSLTLDPVKAGFDEYELKMKSIQTILANTKGENLKSVSVALAELNEYSDKTIYNFANMTENIGKLTTAGINLDDATAVVKGFSNMVALAGGDANAAAGAMEQFGQGLQAGQIKAIDWMSISNRGLGSQSLQKAFFETARAAGTLQDIPLSTTFEEWTKANGGFKGSLEAGWLTTDVATETLKIMTGDIKSAQELMAMGFDEKTANDMLDIAKNALDSATKVRTLTAFMGTFKEQIGSGWSQVMETIFGDFNESTELFTKLSDKTGAAVSGFFNYVNGMLKAWDEMGGRAHILRTVQNLLSPISATLGLIAKAWGLAFPKGGSGSGLATLSKALEHITRPLNVLGKLIRGQISPMEALHRLFEINTHAVRNFLRWVGGLIKPLTDMVGIKLPSGNGFFKFLDELGDSIRDVIIQITELIKKGESIGDIFGSVNFDMPSVPGLPDMPKMGSMFGGGNEDESKIASLTTGVKDLTGSVLGFTDADAQASRGMMFNPDADITGGRVRDLGTLEDQLARTEEQVQTVGDKAGPLLDTLKDKFTGFIKNFSMEDLMASFNLAVLSTFMISISRFFNTLSKSFQGFVGTGEAVNGILESAGNALGSFQTAARAKLITAIAIAIGILAVSLWLLAKIPMDKMATGLAGMAGIMLIMKVGVDSITKAVDAMESKGTPFKLGALSFALLALGAAVLMLAGAFLIFEKVNWEAMLKGLGTIVVVMYMMERLGKLGEGAAKNIFAAGAAIALIAGSMIVLAGALLLFEYVSWESLGKAGVTLLAMTVAIGALALIPYQGIAKVGLAMLAASVGMLAIANALVIFGYVEWESIKKAGAVLAGLTIALGALMLIGGGPVGAASFLAIGGAMIMLATAGLMLNKVDWSSIGKIAVIMVALVAGFAAFLAVISFFAPALILLSAFSGSLAFLALALTGLALAFAVIFPLLAAGAGAFAAFATGAAIAFAVFLQTLALQAPIMKNSFLKILQALLDTIVEAVPMVIRAVKDLWSAIQKEFTEPKKQGLMGDASKSWMDKLKDGIKEKIPQIVEKAKELIIDFLRALKNKAGDLAASGVELIASLIRGIASRVGQIVSAAVDLIIKFAEGIKNGLSTIIKAGVQLIADFLHELASTIRSGSKAIGGGIRDVVDAMKDVGIDIVKGLIGGITSMFGDAMTAIGDLASGMVNKAKGILDIFSPSRVFQEIGKFVAQGMTKGIQDNAAAAIVATGSMVSGQIAVASEYISRFVQDLDQQAIKAGAKAAGVAKEAQLAAKAAERAHQRAEKAEKAAAKTKKNKKDDKAARAKARKADKLDDRAESIARKAEKYDAKALRAEERAEEARQKAARAEEFEGASLIEKAEMRSEDAQGQMDAAKDAERLAAAKLAQAAALREEAKAKGVSKKDAKAMKKEADRLEKQARAQAAEANAQIELARQSAVDAMALQKQAGDEAAALFQARFDAEAKEDADAEAFEKLSDAEKAAERRRQADVLQAKANADLQEAKMLAYTDLEAANELADQAMDQAEQARQYLLEAADFEKAAAQGTGISAAETGGTVVNLDPTAAASIAFNKYASRYDAGVAAAAGTRTVEFNQYNTSPEALSPAEVYRRTNNLLDHAIEKVSPSAA